MWGVPQRCPFERNLALIVVDESHTAYTLIIKHVYYSGREAPSLKIGSLCLFHCLLVLFCFVLMPLESVLKERVLKMEPRCRGSIRQ